MRVAIGSDQGGFALKQEVIKDLAGRGFEYRDFGSYNEDSVDYPDVAHVVGEAVAAGEFDRGILICGTGIGMAMAANKIHGVRAAQCHDTFSARMSREHNDANILAIGGRVVGPGLALDIVRIWLNTPFSGVDRHARRVDKIMALEQAGEME